MRRPFVAGNWKMYNTVRESLSLANKLLPGLNAIKTVDRVICPPFTALFAVSTLLSESDIGLGAQNIHWESSGAYTGEISPGMLAELCQYVIIGHSERREYFGETDQTVNRKIKAALQTGLIPIVCVGETQKQRESGQTAGVVMRQIREGLTGIEPGQVNRMVVAYEPIWAIGTGLASSGEDANEVVAEMIRPTLASLFNNEAGQAVRVLYGGSVKPENASEFFGQSDIDGALVGGASLKADDFIKIVEAAA